jgi:hypothetical protein
MTMKAEDEATIEGLRAALAKETARADRAEALCAEFEAVLERRLKTDVVKNMEAVLNVTRAQLAAAKNEAAILRETISEMSDEGTET